MIEIGGNQRARGLVNMMDGIEHPNRGWVFSDKNNFCRVIKDNT